MARCLQDTGKCTTKLELPMANLLTKARKKLSMTAAGFSPNRSGNFAMMLALLTPVVFLSAGLMIDTTRLYSAQTSLGDAIDIAVLATTQDLTTGVIAEQDAEQAVRRWIETNLADTPIGGNDVVIDAIIIDKDARTVEIKAHVMIDTTLMQIAGQDQKRVEATTKAAYSNTKVEVAMALDVTGSMSGSKMRSLQQAASRAVDILIPGTTTQDRIRIGLVPYAASVNIRPVSDRISVNLTDNRDCAIERTGRNEFTDEFANNANPINTIPVSSGLCVNAEITEMTSNAAQLKSSINRYSASGWTAGHLGVSWAHYMLSPNWNRAWGSNARVANYGDGNVKKVAVIMTDGEFNTYLTSGSGGNNRAESENTAARMCQSMKDKNVKVYAIAFQAPPAGVDIMQRCANPDEGDKTFFYDANSEAQLVEAFEAIARDIQGLKLVK